MFNISFVTDVLTSCLQMQEVVWRATRSLLSSRKLMTTQTLLGWISSKSTTSDLPSTMASRTSLPSRTSGRKNRLSTKVRVHNGYRWPVTITNIVSVMITKRFNFLFFFTCSHLVSGVRVILRILLDLFWIKNFVILVLSIPLRLFLHLRSTYLSLYVF